MDLVNLVDARTLAFVTCLGGLIMAMTMTGLYLGGTRKPGILHWALGGLLYAMGYLLGFLLLSIALQVPGWLATSMANNLMSLGQIMILLGVQRFLGRKAWYWALALPLVAFLMALFPALRQFPTPFIIDTVLLSLPCLIAAWMLWRDKQHGMALVQRATATLLGLMGLFLVGRAGYLLLTRAISGSFDQHAMQILAFLTAMVFSFLLTMALVLMVFRSREIHLREVARRDSLTGLRNRYALNEISHREMSLAQRHEFPLSVISIDLDHFKHINDRHGHACGDQVLKQTAIELSDEFRDSDLLFRVGGEEFLVLLPLTGLDEARTAAERVRQRLATTTLRGKGGEPLQVTASLGVAEIDPGHEDWDSALQRVDLALYRAKESGRNQVVSSSPQQQAEGECALDH